MEPGQIVFARTGASVGKSYLYDPADGELVYAGFLINVEPDPRKLNPRYLATYVQSRAYWNWVDRISIRSGQPGINGREYGQLPVPLPESAIQDAIAEVSAGADAQVRSVEGLIAKKEAIRIGIMQQLLAGATRLPGSSEPWEHVALGDVVEYLQVASLPRSKLNEVSGVGCLHYGDIHTSQSVRLDAARTRVPSAPRQALRRANRLSVGDLVFVDASEDRAGVGKSIEIHSLPRQGMVAGLHTIAARFDKGALADGFKAYLQFVPGFRESLLRLAAGTKVLATTRDHISSVELRLPKVPEQRAIAGVLRDCDEEIETLRLCLGKARAVKEGAIQEMFGRYVEPPIEERAPA